MQLNLMQHRVTIKRRAPSQDGLFIAPGTPATVSQRVACLIQEKVGEVSPHATGDRLRYTAICFMPIGTDIEPRKGTDQTDTIVVESHPTIPTGSEFLVVFVGNHGGVMSLAAQHLEVYLRTP